MRARIARLTDRDWRLIDRVYVLFLLVFGWAEVLTTAEGSEELIGSVLIGGLMALGLLWRRTRPVEVLVALVALGALGEVFFLGPPDSIAQVLVIITATYSAGAHADGRRSVVGIVIAVIGMTALAILFDPTDIFFPVVFFAIVPWLVGRMLRNNLLVARELAERAEQAEHAREEQERRAIALERNRIARELHDVLAHNLSVVVVQAGAARRIAERNPERAAEVAELIETTGRETLAELRHLFGPVRRGEGEPLTRPPGLGDLDSLVARARGAGLRVALLQEGERVPLPTGVDLTAYRVVQEALTNALKYAGAASATVTVRYERDEVVLAVEDDGSGATPERLAELGGGYGLAGMRERVELYGGLLEAGRRRGGGFAVRATLPTRMLVPA